MRRTGEALARHPAVTPTRFGPRDPARTQVTDLASQLAALGARAAADYSASVLLEDPDRLGHGSVRCQADPFAVHPPEFVQPSVVELSLVPDDPQALIPVLVDLAEVHEAFYGRVSAVPHAAQSRGPFALAMTERHGLSPSGGVPPTWERPPYQPLEMQVPDVYWAQVFGPAFVEMWGEQTLQRAGVARQRLDHGGYLVVASAEPPPFDPQAPSPESYEWKSSVYDTIGEARFRRLDLGWGKFGEQVPLMTQHAAFLD